MIKEVSIACKAILREAFQGSSGISKCLVTKLLHIKQERNNAQLLLASITILLLPCFHLYHTRLGPLPGDRLFSRACSDRTSGCGFKLKES